jgi:hypothetical protein
MSEINPDRVLTKGQRAILEPFLSLGHKQECPYYFTGKCNCKEKKKNE